jgi:hypothetical protein
MAQKKKSKRLLLLDRECLSVDELIIPIDKIENKLIHIFRNHIGKENYITPYDLFCGIFGIEPDSINRFQREYWWNVVKQILRQMRSQGKLFVINKGQYLFILKTEEEKQEFKEKIDRSIESLKNVKLIADDWVKNSKWRDL